MTPKTKQWIGAAGDPLRVSQMANACLDEAMGIRLRQEALVKAGIRTEPDEQYMRRAELLEGAQKLLDQVAPHTKEVLKIIRRP